MKRKVSKEFKKARREMIEQKTKCHECENFATELHHIIAFEDGGTDKIENLMPLCEECHKEYTSEQTIERNKIWVEIGVNENDEMTAQFKGDSVERLGEIGSPEETEGVALEDNPSPSKIHYEYEWILTLEIPACSRRESKEKLKKFKSELFSRYGVTDDVWLTGIKRWNGKK
jgi:hypothetical protein